MSTYYYVPAEPVRAIFAQHWPGLLAGSHGHSRGPTAPWIVAQFNLAMIEAQAALIRHYLPVMAAERLPWAQRTLARLDREAIAARERIET